MPDETEFVMVRVTPEEKAKLRKLAHQKEASMSDVVRLWIARAKLA